jgi:hypothetical protein
VVSFTLPVTITGWVTENSWCDNKGPHIEINTSALYGGYTNQFTFMNNLNDKSTLEKVGEANADALDGDVWTDAVPKQPSRGGAGGNPFVYIDPEGDTDLSNAIYIGRCVQDGKIGQFNHGRWSVQTTTPGTQTLSLSGLECSNRTSNLSLTSETSANAVSGYLVFTNSWWGLNPQHIAPSDVAASWPFTNGLPLSVRKGGGATGAGGNPLVTSEAGKKGPFKVADLTAEQVTGNGVDINAVDINGYLVDGLGNQIKFLPFTVNGQHTTKHEWGRCNKI